MLIACKSSTITRGAKTVDKQPKNPFHPGEMLLEESLEPMGMSQTALDLAETLGTSPKIWLNVQTTYDLAKAVEARRVA